MFINITKSFSNELDKLDNSKYYLTIINNN